MWHQRAFSVEDREFLWLDVLLAALWRGDWDGFETRLREGLACETYAYEADDPPDQDAVDSAANAFRYDHDLLTAEETEEWLARAGLTLDTWTRYFVRQELRGRWAPRLAEIVATYPPTDADMAEHIIADGVCSGTFRRLANALASPAAMRADDDQDADETVTRDSEHVDALVARAEAFIGVIPDLDLRGRLLQVAALTQWYEGVCQRLITPDALNAQIESSRLDWLTVSLERLPFTEESMVREARLCCREDNLTLGQLAARIGRQVLTERVRLEDCPDGLRDSLLSAPPGEFLGPLALEDSFQALVVQGKDLPRADDPVIRDLAERAVVDAAARRARVLHVRWHHRL